MNTVEKPTMTGILKSALVLICCISVAAGADLYHSWASSSNIADTFPFEDTDGDGLTNFMEYALGTNPLIVDGPAHSSLEGSVSFTKGSHAVASGNLTWDIEESEFLEDFTWQTRQATVEDANHLSLDYQIDGQRRFFRLKVTRATHPAALDYAQQTGLTGEPLVEVSKLLYDLEDNGIAPQFLVLLGDRYMARSGTSIQAVIGGAGTVSNGIASDTDSMVFDGSAKWLEFDNPLRSPALENYSLFAVASAVSTSSESLVASSFSSASERGARIMFNGSSSWGAGPGRVWADANRGASNVSTGWSTATAVHSGSQLLPLCMTYTSSTFSAAGDKPPSTPAPRLTVSAGITRSSAAFNGLSTTLWNDSAYFRIGANLNGGAHHRGRIALVMVTGSPVSNVIYYQKLATAPVRAGVVSGYGTGVVAVFDGDSVTEGAGSPGASYGKWSWPAQLFGNQTGQFAGGQWLGKFTASNIAVGGRPLSSNEASWEHTTRHILTRPEWGTRYYFAMNSHNQISYYGLEPMYHPTSLARVKRLWNMAKSLGSIPVCVGLVSGQIQSSEYEMGYAAVKQMAEFEGVQFVDTAGISQMLPGQFPKGADYFYVDIIHPTEKGYRLIAQEVAAAISFPGSTAPRSTERPLISGSPTAGGSITCSPGIWDHQPDTITYQWMQDASDLVGATFATYSPTEGDLGRKLSCRVTASNPLGKAERTTSHTAAVTP